MNKLKLTALIITSLFTFYMVGTSCIYAEEHKEESYCGIQDMEDEDINSQIRTKVKEAITSQERKIKNTVSQNTYGEYTLKWGYFSDGVNDLLLSIKSTSGNVQYEYDGNGKRVVKRGYNETVQYIYNESGRLIEEITSNGQINYIYDDYGNLYGFVYDNNFYEYEYDGTYIIGINYEGQTVCSYIYDNNVLKGTYIGNQLCKDMSFIGNINSMRYNGVIVDYETEWVYDGMRYIDMGNSRYIDGISRDQIFKYLDEDGITYELLSNIYERDYDTVDMPESPKYARAGISGAEKTKIINIIARTIYFESHGDELDQIGVAQVIKNRMKKNNKTAMEVVSQSGQFLGYDIALGSTAVTEDYFWSQALANASRLYNNTSLVYESGYFDTADGFRSLNNSFQSGETPKFKKENGCMMAYMGNSYAKIKKVYCPVYETKDGTLYNYTSRYIDSIETLKLLKQNFGKSYKYNIFFTTK